jgi:glutathione S-transferase
MSQNTVVSLSPQLLAELEPMLAETHASLETVVSAAVTAYLRQWEKRALREQLAREYDELAAMWPELEQDLGDGQWLVVENEALEHLEKALEK